MFVITLCIISVVLALGFAAMYYKKTVMVIPNADGAIESLGPEESACIRKELSTIQRIAGYIREGADEFLKLEYTMIAKYALVLIATIWLVISWQVMAAFLIGLLMSSAPSWIGMKTATKANEATTFTARLTKKIQDTLRVALGGGSVMGSSVGGFALLGITIVYLLFSNLGANVAMSWIGFSFLPFPMVITAYSFGCSFIAIFARNGGGIYTKAADTGADLVGKTELNIPEDDPRNPATIADNVGDNVGDVSGLGSDLLESDAGAIISAMLLGLAYSDGSLEVSKALSLFPMGVAACGLISSLIGLFIVLNTKLSSDPHKDLNRATIISATLTGISTIGLSYVLFKDLDCTIFRFGWVSPAIPAFIGAISGVVIGKISEIYTSSDYKATKNIAKVSKEGSALTIIEGLAAGLQSALPTIVTVIFALLISYLSAGIYGISVAGVGMLAFVATTVSVDTYGPISDNAGGIAEMSRLDKSVRDITDALDAVGNTTAAIGKGFAIGSAAFAALGLMVNYLNAYKETVSLDATNPLVLSGIFLGAMLPAFFSGMLMRSVRKAADAMVLEVRRQFSENPRLIEGLDDPDYKKCVAISSSISLNEMRYSSGLAVAVPVVCGFLLGPEFVAGILLGGIITAILLAILCGNAGGAWDNAKKYIEAGKIEGEGKGSVAHIASVVGDTVGDPLKDTVGPCLDIFIKIESTVALLMVPMFSSYNLLGLIQNHFF